MLFDGIQLINEEFSCDHVQPEQMDALWERGWRHFGEHFFRYSLAIYADDIRLVTPLRIRLAAFTFSKSQRRNLRRNSSLRTEVSPLRISEQSRTLFARHIERFHHGVPESINDFVPETAAASPADTRQISVYDGDRLIAESYFDVGETAVSGIYGMFEPDLAPSGLGIFTLLKEIELALLLGKAYYYLGYAYDGSSFYDYKKRFRASEVFDWQGGWHEFCGAGAGGDGRRSVWE